MTFVSAPRSKEDDEWPMNLVLLANALTDSCGGTRTANRNYLDRRFRDAESAIRSGVVLEESDNSVSRTIRVRRGWILAPLSRVCEWSHNDRQTCAARRGHRGPGELITDKRMHYVYSV
jgi:hypothetical protein